MENNKLISIIMPAYNAGVFIENTIRSVLAQTYSNFEIVAVNDGSKDNTLEILERLAGEDSRIKVISQENGGVSAARNTAIRASVGDYITCVDADDSLPEDALEILISEMKDDVDFVICSHSEIRFRKMLHIEKKAEYAADELDDRFIDFGSVIWWPWGKLYRASIIRDNNLLYDTSISFGEDHVFNLLYSKNIKGRVVVSDKVAYNYYIIRGGLCSKYIPSYNSLQKYIYQQIANYFGGDDKIRYSYKKHYIGHYVNDCVEYYIAWLSFRNAVGKIKETFEVYDEYLDDEIITETFGDEGYRLIKGEKYREFCKWYIKNHPKQTIWRKIRRTIRRFIEKLQRVFLKRA